MGLLERIREIQNLRSTTTRKGKRQPLSLRSWSMAAGLKPNHLSVLVGRLEEDPDAGLEAQTASQLAAAVGVSLSYFVKGDGPIEADAAKLPLHPRIESLAPAMRDVAVYGFAVASAALYSSEALQRLPDAALAELVRDAGSWARGREAIAEMALSGPRAHGDSEPPERSSVRRRR